MKKALYSRDEASIGSLQKLRFYPLVATSGQGAILIDETGRELIDLSAAWGAASLGYGHPAFVRAVAAAAAAPAGASILSASNQPAIELAEQLLDSFPIKEGYKVWFGHSGSDANETVYRAVTKATGKNGIIAFHGAYHGCTSGSMAVSGHSVQAAAKKADDLILLPYPDQYRGAPTADEVLDLLRTSLENAEQPIAAAFIEPIQSDGGMIVPPSGFLRKFAEICHEYNVLTISDEVKVGLGRTGKMHCFEHEGFVPDILVLGKGLGGGLPLSAVIAPEKILDCASAFAMQTLHGNPICCSAGLSVLQIIDEQGLIEEAELKGGRLHDGLRELAERHSLIGDVRGRGLACGVELVLDRQTREPAKSEAAKIVYRAFQLGVVLYYVGMNSNVLEFTPPLTITDVEIDKALMILDQAFKDVSEGYITSDMLADFTGW